MQTRSQPFLAIAAFVSVLAYTLSIIYTVLILSPSETPSLNVDHFMAGAGDTFLVVRFSLALLSTLWLTIWLISFISWKKCTIYILFIGVIVGSFTWHINALQKFAPDFNEEHFNQLCIRFESKAIISQNEVRKILGKPLFAAPHTALQKNRPHHEAWLYSYMPSCGWGWSKRVIYFDSSGNMIDFISHDEP